MNRKQLIDSIALEAGLSKACAERALAATLKSVGDALAEGEGVTLVGFGTFSAKRRAARAGRNPQTGEAI